ncbi:MAG: FISUMP domain-containing protein [Flavobacteriales bacterium]|jgi:uncharacterized protein (TIGR02145 family)
MKTIKFFYGLCLSSFLLLAVSTAIVSCKRDEDIERSTNDRPISPDLLGAMKSVDVYGQIVDEAGNPISGAMITAGFGTQSVVTDERGFFLLRDIVGYEHLALIRVVKDGYFHGSRSFIPAEGMNKVKIALLAKNQAGSFHSANGGTVSLENLAIDFPPDVIGLEGEPYVGMVHVSINYIDPSDLESMFEQMPGNMYGLRNNELDVLKSFGMAGVELSDANGNELQLLPGANATVRFTVPAEMLSTAPGTIPLWHYSEEHGYWMEEGAASLEGNTYVGQVAHFSFWNCDDFNEAVEFTCHVFDNTHPGPGLPLSGVIVELVSEQYGSASGFTDDNGTVTGLVPQGEELVLNIYMSCGGYTILVYSQVVGPFTTDSELTINVDDFTNSVTVVHGQLQDTDGQPVEGVVFFNDWAFTFTTNGYYHMLTCNTVVEITGWYYNGVEACFSDPIVLNVAGEDIEQNIICDGCDQSIAAGDGVSDQQGNYYPTIIIGDQEWIAENLRTTLYQNGDAINEYPSTAEWSSASEGAWCYYGSNPSNEAMYGKIYNWHAVNDPRNVCPSGFHVPNDNDWYTVESFLAPLVGSSELVGAALKSVGIVEDGSGLWNAPNFGANNMSQFKGHPGGARYSSGGYYNMGSIGYWWSSTTLGNNSARVMRLHSDSTTVNFTTAPEENGFSIRCMRDL